MRLKSSTSFSVLFFAIALILSGTGSAQSPTIDVGTLYVEAERNPQIRHQDEHLAKDQDLSLHIHVIYTVISNLPDPMDGG